MTSAAKSLSVAGHNAVHERLRRLLFLVPYVAKHPGITVEALAHEVGLSREALLEELDFLALVGRPPFQPDDYIDLHVENDRVYVDLDQRLSAPPRLTAAEAAALSAAAELLRPATGGTLETALQKLERALPQGARDRYREMNQKIDAQLDGPSELGPLTRAIGEHKEIEFDYWSPTRGASERRTARPLELFGHRGQWYLQAYCQTRSDVRLFRVDRIFGLTVTARTFEPQSAERAAIPNPASRAGTVRVRFSKTAAPYIRERFGDEAVPGPDGSVEVRVESSSERWLVGWVLSFGGEACVLEPASARRAIAAAVRASLES